MTSLINQSLKIKTCKRMLHQYSGIHCKECRKIVDAARYEANSDKNRAYSLARYAANPGKKIATSAARQASNPEKSRAYKEKWDISNPEAVLAKNQNRRARKREVGGKLSTGLRGRLLKLQKGKCACCKVGIESANHMDHVIALSNGGANEDWNIQLLCPSCNLSKSAKDPIDFMQSRGFLI